MEKQHAIDLLIHGKLKRGIMCRNLQEDQWYTIAHVSTSSIILIAKDAGKLRAFPTTEFKTSEWQLERD